VTASGRRVGGVLGGILIAFGLLDILYAAWVGPPLGPYISGASLFLIPGVLLLWWGFRRPSSEAATAVPSYFWTVVAIVVGVLLILFGALTGLVIALVLGASQGLEAAVIPWGIAGLALLAYGAVRAASSTRSARAASEARAILKRIQPLEASPGAVPTASRFDQSSLLKMQHEIADTVRKAYQATSPAIRRCLYAWLVTWILIVAQALVYASNAFGVGLPFLGLPPHTIPLAYAIVAIVVAGIGVLEVGIGVPARLGELAKAKLDLSTGRTPESWELIWWFPFVYAAHLLSTRIRRYPSAAPAPGESSILATSYSFLKFGRWLGLYARFWYTSVFLLILTCAFPVFLAGDLVGITLAQGPAGAAAGWVAALAVMTGAFTYLYYRYRALDPLAEQLAVLQEAETELSRAFWARF
jgi:hypothetical protein